MNTLTQRRKETKGSRRRLGDILAIILCVTILSSLSLGVPMVSEATSTPQILFTSSGANSLLVDIGQSFTMTVNLTDFPNLYAYQVVFKYNGTVVNMTRLTYPYDNVFTGQNYIAMDPPYDTQAKGDTRDHLNFTVTGATLMGEGSVSVSNAALFEATFEVIGVGETTIQTASKDTPAYSFADTFYTFCQDPNQVIEYNVFVTKGLTILSGVSNAAPVAGFIVIPSEVDPKNNLVLNWNPPTGISSYAVAYANVSVGFNASSSYTPFGHITQYIWNWGDGNVTVVNATSPADSFITHAYSSSGIFYMNLTVVNNGTPPLQSAPAKYAILVGLTVPLYNWTWFIYTVVVLIGAVIAIAAARSVLKRVRRRREMRRQKMLKAGPSGLSPAGTQTT